VSADLHADRLLLPAEVATLFGVTPDTIAKWTRKGRLPALRTPGGKYRIRARDARAALEGNEEEAS
jgi:excisionase family DNA binding protein